MKQMKIVLMAVVAIVMGTTFTSCLNSDNDSSWDGTVVVTIDEDYLGRTILLTEDGYTFVPNNPSMLKYADGTFIKRCELAYAFNEGVVFEGDKSKPYGVTVVQIGQVYPTRDYCNRVDTIMNDFPITDITQLWGANGKYLTAVWKFNYTSSSEKVGFEMYPYEVKDNVLIMKLVQSLGTLGQNSASTFCSFKLPTLSEINDELGTSLDTNNDTIQVKLAIRKSENSEELTTTDAVKIKIRY